MLRSVFGAPIKWDAALMSVRKGKNISFFSAGNWGASDAAAESNRVFFGGGGRLGLQNLGRLLFLFP